MVVAAGRVGSAAAPQLTAVLLAAGERTQHVTLDLSQVDYISSAGIRAIESASDQLTADGKTLAVCGAAGATRFCLEIARITQT